MKKTFAALLNSTAVVLAVISVALMFIAAKQQLADMQGGIKVGYNGIKISSIRCGVTPAMTAGTVTVSDSFVTANTIIQLTDQNTGGTTGALRVSARTPGTSFVITGIATDTSIVGYCMIEP